MKALFKNRTFIKLFIAQIISLVGTGITTIALTLLTWQLAKDNAGVVLGVALALKMIAYVFFSPIVSTFANKISRRKWLLSLDLIRAFIILYFPFITDIWEIYILIFLINLASAGFTPIFQATIADIVKEEEEYKKALSYSRLAYDLEQLLSPLLATFLLGLFSFHYLFVLDSISFFISSTLIFFTVLPKINYIKTEDAYIKRLKFGISSYLKTPRLKALFFMYIIVALTSSMIITNSVVFVKDVFNKSDSNTALAFAVAGLGSMLIALLLPKVLQKFSLREVVLSGSIVLIIGQFIAYFNNTWITFLLIWFIFGAGLSIIQVPAGLLIRLSCNPQDSVDYFSANFSLSHFCWMIAYPLTGFLGKYVGLNSTFLVLAIISLIALLLAFISYPNPDELELEHSHDKLSHSHDNADKLHHIGDKYTHTHQKITHKHRFVIDTHHLNWPK
ncbi:MFS transporter [Halarcobacter ebronensis]|uniref:MFS transporter n=1 Tax=Halarcobacter ebronensis TaxID=1462615 RepID=A0A4Q0YIU2_9BACT|nr:MFS transporter [Halarcobacter ebronensis]RXJ69754.1 MFS transporter [Halarcobacter ebronensis]